MSTATAESTKVDISILKPFENYDASRPAQMIDSRSPDSLGKWVRTASLMQLGYALDFYRQDNPVTAEQDAAITKFTDMLYDPKFTARERTEKWHIQAALQTLKILGLNVSRQEKQLENW